MWKQDQASKPASTPPEPPISAGIARGTSSAHDIVGIGESLVIKGDLSASEDLTVRGQVDGSITLPNHTLTVDAQAKLTANIAARAVVVVGNVKGKVTAGERLEIRASGSVVGDVVSPRLVIIDGGNLRGKVEMPRS
jgi:cytoskeletal protein CcmA (bactofilin family)